MTYILYLRTTCPYSAMLLNWNTIHLWSLLWVAHPDDLWHGARCSHVVAVVYLQCALPAMKLCRMYYNAVCAIMQCASCIKPRVMNINQSTFNPIAGESRISTSRGVHKRMALLLWDPVDIFIVDGNNGYGVSCTFSRLQWASAPFGSRHCALLSQPSATARCRQELSICSLRRRTRRACCSVIAGQTVRKGQSCCYRTLWCKVISTLATHECMGQLYILVTMYSGEWWGRRKRFGTGFFLPASQV